MNFILYNIPYNKLISYYIVGYHQYIYIYKAPMTIVFKTESD